MRHSLTYIRLTCPRRPTLFYHYYLNALQLPLLRHVSATSSPFSLPVSLLPKNSSHTSLATFLDYARHVGLDPASTVYKGTHYEYTVLTSLQRLGFTLIRTGGAYDGGVDLIGHWVLPTPVLNSANDYVNGKGNQKDTRIGSMTLPRASALQYAGSSKGAKSCASRPPIRVFVQCKALKKALPLSYVRELNGSIQALPFDWQRTDDSGTLALLATTQPASKGVLQAVGQNSAPMGFLKITTDGLIEQFLWNQAAVAKWLVGVGTTVRYSRGGSVKDLVLTWRGEPVTGEKGGEPKEAECSSP